MRAGVLKPKNLPLNVNQSDELSREKITYTRCYKLYFAVWWVAKEKASVRFGYSWGKVLLITAVCEKNIFSVFTNVK